jgi:hypothetical protein
MQKLHRIPSAAGALVVNIKTARIFKGFFESRKSAQSEENFAEMRTKFAWAPCVYHAGINYNAGAPGRNGPLTRNEQGRMHRAHRLTASSASISAMRTGGFAPRRMPRNPSGSQPSRRFAVRLTGPARKSLDNLPIVIQCNLVQPIECYLNQHNEERGKYSGNRDTECESMRCRRILVACKILVPIGGMIQI